MTTDSIDDVHRGGEEPVTILDNYARIPIAFKVCDVFDVIDETGGRRLQRQIAPPLEHCQRRCIARDRRVTDALAVAERREESPVRQIEPRRPSDRTVIWPPHQRGPIRLRSDAPRTQLECPRAEPVQSSQRLEKSFRNGGRKPQRSAWRNLKSSAWHQLSSIGTWKWRGPSRGITSDNRQVVAPIPPPCLSSCQAP